MIDINKIVSDAIEAEVSKAVARILIGPGLQETVNSFIQTYLEDHPSQAPNLGQLRAQFAEDTEQMLVRISQVNERVDIVRDVAGKHIKELRETLSGMQERFALKDDVADAHRAINTLDQEAHKRMDKLEKRCATPDEIDSDELATTIAEMFQDGTLTITIDKV